MAPTLIVWLALRNHRNTAKLTFVTLSGFFSYGALRRKFSEGSRFGREIPFDPAQGMLRWSPAATRIELFTRCLETPACHSERVDDPTLLTAQHQRRVSPLTEMLHWWLAVTYFGR